MAHSWRCARIHSGGQITTMDGQTHDIERWDMAICFPPCTKTSNAGVKHLFRGHQLNLKRYYDGLCGKALFMALWKADVEKLVIENPTPSKVFDYPKPTQFVHPYYFGDPRSKKTLLWERGVKPLEPTNMVEPECGCHESGTWFMKGGKERQKNRSKLSNEFAKAMAEQWGKPLLEECEVAKKAGGC